MAAGEAWLPTYQASGMRFLYIGDEAVVDLPAVLLAGGKMKGLRQAVNRVARYGYTVEFLDPARVTPTTRRRLVELMDLSRRGDQERGFSMMLGRLFDPGTPGCCSPLVEGPDGAPAAMCQFVPSTAIGGYSLDLMRRDPGEHPNGLLDFALCSTIAHMKEMGMKGLSLNFAALRSILDGESGDGRDPTSGALGPAAAVGRTADRDALALQRQVRAHVAPPLHRLRLGRAFVPVAVQIMRAESLTEVPVIGRLLTTASAKRSGPAVPEAVLAALRDDDAAPATEERQPETTGS